MEVQLFKMAKRKHCFFGAEINLFAVIVCTYKLFAVICFCPAWGLGSKNSLHHRESVYRRSFSIC